MVKTKILPSNEGISAAVAEIEAELKKKKANSRAAYKAILSVEEILFSLYAIPGMGDMSYQILDLPWKKQILLTAKGPRYETAVDDASLNLDLNDIDDDTGDYIRRIVLHSISDTIHYGYRNGVNRIAVDFNPKKQANPVIIAVFAAVAVGLLCRFLMPEALSAGLCRYILNPITDIMLALLKLIVGPLVFLSIETSISQYSNISEFGRVGIKVLLTYFITSVIAILVGFAMFGICSPGIVNSFSAAGTSAGKVSLLIPDAIVGIFPSNAVKAFAENDMLQIILLAVLVGLSVGRLKTYRDPVTKLFNGLNEMLNEMMAIIAKGIPLLAFSSLAGVIISTGVDSLVSVVQIALTSYGGYAVMIVIYMLMLRLFAKINPLIFIKKHAPYMLNAAAIMSSNACIPKSIEECEKLGVPKKVYSFAVPLGATINMDGMTISYVILSLACAKMCGVSVTGPGTVLMLAFTVLMLSMATPGVLGAASANQLALLSVLGLPVEMLPLLLTVTSFVDMGGTASNVTGDIMATLLVSSSENELDMDKYNS